MQYAKIAASKLGGSRGVGDRGSRCRSRLTSIQNNAVESIDYEDGRAARSAQKSRLVIWGEAGAFEIATSDAASTRYVVGARVTAASHKCDTCVRRGTAQITAYIYILRGSINIIATITNGACRQGAGLRGQAPRVTTQRRKLVFAGARTSPPSQAY